MKLKDLKTAYSTLQLIVLHGKYLIPQKPKFPTPLYSRYVKETWSNIKQEKLAKKFAVNQLWKTNGIKTVHEEIKRKLQNNDPLLQQIKNQYEKQTNQFKQQMTKYTNLYLCPLSKMRSCKPIPFFVKKISQEYQQKNQKFQLSFAIEKWKLLPDEEKKKIYEESSNQKLKHLELFNQFVEKHQIPFHRVLHGYRVFQSSVQNIQELQWNINGVDTEPTHSYKHLDSFNRLPQSQKYKYNKLAEQLNQRSQARYQQFLQKWHLTENQLNYINQICQQYNKIIKGKHPKLIKSLLAEGELENRDQELGLDELEIMENQGNNNISK